MWIRQSGKGKLANSPRPTKKMQNLWHACLRRLEQELPAQQFNTWIRPLTPEAARGGFRHAGPRRAEPLHSGARARALCRADPAPGHRSIGGRDIDLKLVLAAAAAGPAASAAPARKPAPDAARAAAAAVARRPGAPEPQFQLRQLRHRQGQSAGARRRHAGRREPGHFLQPAVHLRRRRPGQDAPGAGHRQPARGRAPAGPHPLHPCRAVRHRRGARLPAEVLRGIQALLPLAGPVADRRHPVLLEQGPHPGGVLLRLQRAGRGAQADRDHLRHLSRRKSPACRSA